MLKELNMNPITNNKELKETFKEAIIEVFENRKDILVDAISEAMEDLGMAKAIKEGDKNNLVKEEVVMNYLKKKKRSEKK